MSETDRTSLPIVQMARENDAFRKVVWTGDYCQLVLMAIPEGGEIGGEVHEGHDQLLYFVDGQGEARIGERVEAVKAGDATIVPSGVWHNFRNTGQGRLRLFTTYSPPEHEPGTEQEERPD